MGKKIYLESGQELELLGDPSVDAEDGGSLLGKGGQGNVYKVKNLQTGQNMALKVYTAPQSSAFIENLRKNIMKGPPDNSFLWPKGLILPIGAQNNLYGYVMDVYDGKQYSSFAKIVNGKANFVSKETQIAALIDLVDAFEKLHANGYSYQDLNDGGVIFDCQKGEVLICDNDNVAPSGTNIPIDDENRCVIGKIRYMAPEVNVRMFNPDTYSDRFSLAVMMFMILTRSHPYAGAKVMSGELNAAKERKVYGTEPVFIFHPNDKSNRPDPREHLNAIKAWPTLPDFIQALFIKTFTSGMPSVGKRRDEIKIERQGRTSENEWREALIRWLDMEAICPSCKCAVCATIQGTSFVDTKCPHCGKRVKVVRPLLVIKKDGRAVRMIVLEEGKAVSKSSVTKEKSNDPAFVVVRSPKNADVFGIKNLLPYQWKCSRSGEKGRLVDPYETFPAISGVHIEFDYTFSGDVFYSRY